MRANGAMEYCQTLDEAARHLDRGFLLQCATCLPCPIAPYQQPSRSRPQCDFPGFPGSSCWSTQPLQLERSGPKNASSVCACHSVGFVDVSPAATLPCRMWPSTMRRCEPWRQSTSTSTGPGLAQPKLVRGLHWAASCGGAQGYCAPRVFRQLRPARKQRFIVHKGRQHYGTFGDIETAAGPSFAVRTNRTAD